MFNRRPRRIVLVVVVVVIALVVMARVFRRPKPVSKAVYGNYGVHFRMDVRSRNITVVQSSSQLPNARIFSPVLGDEKLVSEVNSMYATSRRVRHFYENPKLKNDKFTVIMLSYKRTDNLYVVFKHYCSMNSIIDKILIIWNNVGVPIPQELLTIPCSFPIVFLTPSLNSLNNRFIPYDEIDTECVFSLDDDHLLSEKALQFGFDVWKIFPHLLVGYVPRTHGQEENGQYYYRRGSVRHGEVYSMVLTVAMFLNHKYLGMYTNDSPKEITQFVDQYKNGEDISMVAMIANYLRKIDRPQCVCLWVNEQMKDIFKKKVFFSGRKKVVQGLHHQKDHYKERSSCINMLADLFDARPPLEYCSLEVLRINN